MEIIRAEGLEKVYDREGVPVHALRGIDLTVERGEYSVIAGPSGSGKTTLLNMIGALDSPTGGEVFFEGEPLGGRSRSELSSLRLERIGYVFQAYNLIPVLSAMENVEFTLLLKGVSSSERRKRAHRVLDDLGIADLADKRPNEMSGGQQQRVAVARAMVSDPSLVLADEPTANLDTKTGASLLDLMERMNRDKGTTFVFSSHDPQVIERGRRLIRLEDGRISGTETSREEDEKGQ